MLMPSNHTRHRCKQPCDGCQFCDGGLFLCSVCGGGEGSLPTDCPGEKMSPEQQQAVYDGELNYRDGEWREEASGGVPLIERTANALRRSMARSPYHS